MTNVYALGSPNTGHTHNQEKIPAKVAIKKMQNKFGGDGIKTQ